MLFNVIKHQHGRMACHQYQRLFIGLRKLFKHFQDKLAGLQSPPPFPSYMTLTTSRSMEKPVVMKGHHEMLLPIFLSESTAKRAHIKCHRTANGKTRGVTTFARGYSIHPHPPSVEAWLLWWFLTHS